MTDQNSRIERANRAFAAAFTQAPPARPRLGLAVVACMDTRLDVLSALGLAPGDAHILRNAGGIVTDDVIRSLCLSQRLLGTGSVVLVHHTDCGLQGVSDQEFVSRLSAETGRRPPWEVGGFRRVEESVRASMARLAESPFLIRPMAVAGFVYETETGRLRQIHPT